MTCCRVCARPLGSPILDLGAKPLANAFLDTPSDPEVLYPLELGMCMGCGTVQLHEGVDPGELFGGDYAYHSSVNRPYVEQCHRLVDMLVDRLALGPDDVVAEIGSNDGYLLRRYVERGVGVLGWEPAGNLAEQARTVAVSTFQEFFGPAAGEYLDGKARVIHANNVLAHAPDILGILRGVASGLAPDGVLIVETPYVAPMVDHCLYDTIYHEHLFYWSATAFQHACRATGLTIVDVERLASHGGSLRLWVTRQGTHWRPSPTVEALFIEEHRRGISTPGFYAGLQARVDARIHDTRTGLVALHEQGLRLAGYGAAAKGTMLLNALDLPEGTISHVIDATPGKQGRFMPGVHVPVDPPSALDEAPPDAILILAWNWADAIRAQHPGFQGRWLSPMPMLHDLGNDEYVGLEVSA